MQENVTYRPIRGTDHSRLAEIIAQTWGFDQGASSIRNAVRLGLFYLKGALAESEFSNVAVVNGRPVGVILARGRRIPLRQRSHVIGAILCALRLSVRGRDRRCLAMLRRENDSFHTLLRGIGKEYDGELTLFIVDEGCRGQGVGRELFTSFVSYEQQLSSRLVYILTDTASNYGFYEHQGASRVAEDKGGESCDADDHTTFFVYEYSIPDDRQQ